MSRKYVVVVIILLLGIAAIAAFTEFRKPSENLPSAAENALMKAEECGARRYTNGQLKKAEEYLQAARMEKARQKGRLPALRTYEHADSLFNLALQTADSAVTATIARVDGLRLYVLERHLQLKSELESWRQALDGSLLNYRAEKHWQSAVLSDSMAVRLYEAEEYEAALETQNRAFDNMNLLAGAVQEYDDDAARNSDLWKSWVDETVSKSRKSGTYAIVVDKSAHRLYLLKSGKVLKTYDCELGYNSAHQKMFSGDGATPEGMYKITVVKRTGSKYYKALLLNYPNDRDKKRFSENKKKGIISRDARIGGLIEIHGEGGRRNDWTDGCVALTNSDVDDLMKYTSVGTAVTIVRKLERLQ